MYLGNLLCIYISFKLLKYITYEISYLIRQCMIMIHLCETCPYAVIIHAVKLYFCIQPIF